MANTYFLISSQTVGSGGAGNVYLTSIPQTYTDLLVIVSTRSGYSGSNDLNMWFNSYGTGTYSSANLYGNGSSASSTTGAGIGTGQVSVGLTELTTSTANAFSSHSIYIPNYTSSNYKSMSIDAVYENNATAATQTLIAGLWSNTAAISQISFGIATSGGAANSLTQYSSFYLYGIKNS